MSWLSDGYSNWIGVSKKAMCLECNFGHSIVEQGELNIELGGLARLLASNTNCIPFLIWQNLLNYMNQKCTHWYKSSRYDHIFLYVPLCSPRNTNLNFRNGFPKSPDVVILSGISACLLLIDKRLSWRIKRPCVRLMSSFSSRLYNDVGGDSEQRKLFTIVAVNGLFLLENTYGYVTKHSHRQCEFEFLALAASQSVCCALLVGLGWGK